MHTTFKSVAHRILKVFPQINIISNPIGKWANDINSKFSEEEI